MYSFPERLSRRIPPRRRVAAQLRSPGTAAASERGPPALGVLFLPDRSAGRDRCVRRRWERQCAQRHLPATALPPGRHT